MLVVVVDVITLFKERAVEAAFVSWDVLGHMIGGQCKHFMLVAPRLFTLFKTESRDDVLPQ